MPRRASRVQVVGPLECYQSGFEVMLAGLGYTPLSAANQVRVMRHLSIWLEERDLDAAGLLPGVVEAYLEGRRAEGYTCWLSVGGLRPVLGYLRGLGVAPVPVRPDRSGPLDELVERYRRYLVEERGLAATTVRRYLAQARGFLAGWVDDAGSRLGELDAAQVTGLVVDQGGRRSVGSAKVLVTVLRSLVRLGLRAGEVAALRLDDLDWRRGEIIIRGKGRRDERLPLPVDVGEAVVDYLRRDRPAVRSRVVFIRVRAPHWPMTGGSVKAVVRFGGRPGRVDGGQRSSAASYRGHRDAAGPGAAG